MYHGVKNTKPLSQHDQSALSTRANNQDNASSTRMMHPSYCLPKTVGGKEEEENERVETKRHEKTCNEPVFVPRANGNDFTIGTRAPPNCSTVQRYNTATTIKFLAAPGKMVRSIYASCYCCCIKYLVRDTCCAYAYNTYHTRTIETNGKTMKTR